MEKKKLHPAVETASKRAKQRYLIFAVALILCAIIAVLGFVIKPKAEELKPEAYTKDTAVGTYVKSEISIISPMFSQDALDKDGNVIGENYHILTVDTQGNKFMLTVSKEYYESELKPLESNVAQNVNDDSLEIIDENLKMDVYGYVREMSGNLKQQLGNYIEDYEQLLFGTTLEAVEKPEVITPVNYFFVAAGFVGIISFIILITAFSASANLSRVKAKYEEKNEEKTDKAKKKKKKD